MSRKLIFITGYILFFFIMGGIFGLALNYFSKHPVKENRLFLVKPIDTSSHEYIIEKILEYNIQHPDIVVAQYQLESGHLTSLLSQKSNNIFGMKSPWIRETTALNPKTFEYAKFSSIDSCIIDYKMWQIQYANNLSREKYLVKLSHIYASDTNYIKKLLKLIKNEKTRHRD